jgi:hypothetical protein
MKKLLLLLSIVPVTFMVTMLCFHYFDYQPSGRSFIGKFLWYTGLFYTKYFFGFIVWGGLLYYMKKKQKISYVEMVRYILLIVSAFLLGVFCAIGQITLTLSNL